MARAEKSVSSQKMTPENPRERPSAATKKAYGKGARMGEVMSVEKIAGMSPRNRSCPADIGALAGMAGKNSGATKGGVGKDQTSTDINYPQVSSRDVGHHDGHEEP